VSAPADDTPFDDTAFLVRNIRRVCGDPALPLPEPFDPRDDRHVDLAACLLLHRFRTANSADAFTVLVQIALPRASLIARRITRQLGLAVDPDDLVASFFARLFVDLRQDQPLVHRFLGLAHTSMRNDAFNQLRQYRRAQARHAIWGERLLGTAQDPVALIAEREQSVILQRSGTAFLLVVNQCFHELPERDRRVLLAREVDGLSYDGIAEALGLPRNQVGMILKRARARLAERIDERFERLQSEADAARARRHAGPGPASGPDQACAGDAAGDGPAPATGA
jgi:RNA polymerase sigma factor (sigma-70 family)